MSLAQQVLSWLGIAQGFALLGVLLARRHYRRLPVFTLYVGAVRVSSVAFMLPPTFEI